MVIVTLGTWGKQGILILVAIITLLMWEQYTNALISVTRNKAIRIIV